MALPTSNYYVMNVEFVYNVNGSAFSTIPVAMRGYGDLTLDEYYDLINEGMEAIKSAIEVRYPEADVTLQRAFYGSTVA